MACCKPTGITAPIGRDSDLPFILVRLGVLDGAFSFGVIGIFLGPTFPGLEQG